VDIHHVRTNPRRHLGLVLQFFDGFLNYIRPRRVKDYELIGMEACPQLVPLGESSALLQATDNLVAFGQVVYGVTALRMCLHRENLTVDPKAADPVVSAELKRSQQRLGIGHTKIRQFQQAIGPLHARYGRSRRRAKLDRLVSEYAAKAKANHVFQFIHVMLSCSTVAIDTQTKYGT
jgi:hypothetical protein